MQAQRELDDATVEALLRGGAVPADLEPLATAVGALRTLPGQPVRPSDELAARMATGDFASAVAPRPSRRSAGRHVGRRRFTALPLRVKVAAGGVLALGGLASATAAGALPEPARHGVESVIETVTPFEFSDSNDLGEDVSDDAKDGGVDGGDVSEDAKEQGNQPDDVRNDDAVVPPTPDVDEPGKRPAQTPPGTKPTENPGETKKPTEPGQPDDKGKPDEAAKPDPEDPPEKPAEPRSDD